MPKPPEVRDAMITDFILLKMLERGGEWPDWGDPIKVALIAELAGSLKNKAVGRQITNLAQKGIGG